MLIWGANLILKTLDTKDVSFSDKVALMDNPYDVYNAYMDVVKESFEHLSSLTAHNPHNEVSEHFNTLENITLEYVPLLDALPVEMSEREKTEALKKYYNRRVASAMELPNMSSLVKMTYLRLIMNNKQNNINKSFPTEMKRIILTFAAILGFVLKRHQTVKSFDYQGFEGLDISTGLMSRLKDNNYSIVIISVKY